MPRVCSAVSNSASDPANCWSRMSVSCLSISFSVTAHCLPHRVARMPKTRSSRSCSAACNRNSLNALLSLAGAVTGWFDVGLVDRNIARRSMSPFVIVSEPTWIATAWSGPRLLSPPVPPPPPHAASTKLAVRALRSAMIVLAVRVLTARDRSTGRRVRCVIMPPPQQPQAVRRSRARPPRAARAVPTAPAPTRCVRLTSTQPAVRVRATP